MPAPIDALAQLPPPTDLEFCFPYDLPEKIYAILSFPDGTTQQIEVSLDTSFGPIRQYCSERINEPPENTLLCAGMYFLEDEDTWGTFGSNIYPNSPFTALKSGSVIHCFKAVEFPIQVEFNGVSYTPQVTVNNTVEDIIDYVQRKSCNTTKVFLTLGTNHLLPTHSIYSLQPRSDSRFIVTIDNSGGGCPPSFVDVQNEDALLKRQFSSSAPKWRICSDGINIEGKCTNSDCPAHNHMVIYRHVFHLFDLLHTKAYCPICHKEIVPMKPGFANCLWRIVSLKTTGSFLTLPYRRVEKEYQTYDEAEAGMVQFTLLHIEALPLDQEYKLPKTSVQSEEVSEQPTPLPDEKASPASSPPVNDPPLVVPEHCMVCLSSLSSKDCALLPCGHGAHKGCLEEWKESSTHCVHCDSPLVDIVPCPATA